MDFIRVTRREIGTRTDVSAAWPDRIPMYSPSPARVIWGNVLVDIRSLEMVKRSRTGPDDETGSMPCGHHPNDGGARLLRDPWSQRRWC